MTDQPHNRYTDDPDNPLFGLYTPSGEPINEPKTPEPIQNEIQKYRQALEQEFKRTTVLNDIKDLGERTQNFFADHVQDAAAQVVWLSAHAESESTRLNASKYIIDQALKDNEEGKDPVRDLLKELSKTQTNQLTQPNE